MNGVIGHDHAVAAFTAALGSGRMHHAWLLAGSPGIGKAQFAEAAALRMLAEAAGPPPGGTGLFVPDEHPIGRLIAAGSHPDYRRLARLPREKGDGFARSITVDQVRDLARLFGTTPSLSARRAVVIDAVDDLERAGANALLKNLEEPPAGTVFLLVSHAPGRLLPTIRSRCRVLRFEPLDDEACATVLRRALPDSDADEIVALARVAEGAPGRALGYAGLDIAGLDNAITRLIATGDPGNAIRASLAKALGGASAAPRYAAFLDRLPTGIAAAARGRQGARLVAALDGYEKARSLADAAPRLSLDPATVTFTLGSFAAGLADASDTQAP